MPCTPKVLGASLVATLCAASLAQSWQRNADPAALPRLDGPRVHLYVQEAYEAFPADITDAVANRYAELVDAGMDCSRHLLDWADLEPSPGVFDVDSVIEALDRRIAQGTPRQFVNITVVDSFGVETAPRYVQDLLAQGARWDNPRITGPFGDLRAATTRTSPRRPTRSRASCKRLSIAPTPSSPGWPPPWSSPAPRTRRSRH